MFNCMPRLYDGPDLKPFILVVWGQSIFACCLAHRGSTGDSLSLHISVVYRQIFGIPMGTNYAPLVPYLFLFCYERDFMKDLSSDYQVDVIKAFNSTSRYLDDLLNIDNPYFEGTVNQTYPSELQLNKANTSDTEAPFLDLNLSIPNGFVSSKIYVKVMTLILI